MSKSNVDQQLLQQKLAAVGFNEQEIGQAVANMGNDNFPLHRLRNRTFTAIGERKNDNSGKPLDLSKIYRQICLEQDTKEETLFAIGHSVRNTSRIGYR